MSNENKTEKKLKELLQRCKYKHTELIYNDILNTLTHFKELALKPDKFFYINGTPSKELISLTGTIPVNFKNSVYNIPIQIFISEFYPYEAPACYVRPTREMSINVSSSVDSNGRLYLPSLAEWKYPITDLYILVNLITIEFSENSPVYTRAKMNQNKSSKNSSAELKSKTDQLGKSCCPICLDTINELISKNVQLMSSQCGHVMCKTCVDGLFQAKAENPCPYCKTNLTKSKIHNLFI